MAKRQTSEISAPLGIDYQDIYDALAQAGMKDSIANVVMLCNHLRTTARDAASDVWRYTTLPCDLP